MVRCARLPVGSWMLSGKAALWGSRTCTDKAPHYRMLSTKWDQKRAGKLRSCPHCSPPNADRELDCSAKDAVAALIKRLAHRNANVQLYTLELANALSQNCGNKMHKELASRSFTEALLRLAADRNTHQQVKSKILERMGEWTEAFARDPDLGIMDQAYSRLQSQSKILTGFGGASYTGLTRTDFRSQLAPSIKTAEDAGHRSGPSTGRR